MTEARPYASLSSGLLARKGTAKPAMRPQGFTSFEDLGWNDMGHGQSPEPVETVQHVPSSISALTPSPRSQRPADAEAGDPAEVFESFEDAPEEIEVAVEASADEPVEAQALSLSVGEQQQAIIEKFQAEVAVEAPLVLQVKPKGQVVPLPRRGTAVAGKKAAFTLRLDAERHLRLRLACAVLGRSAQQIVTAALDESLAAIPELDALAARMPTPGAKRN